MPTSTHSCTSSACAGHVRPHHPSIAGVRSSSRLTSATRCSTPSSRATCAWPRPRPRLAWGGVRPAGSQAFIEFAAEMVGTHAQSCDGLMCGHEPSHSPTLTPSHLFVWSDLPPIERASVKAAQPPEHWMLDGWQVVRPAWHGVRAASQPLDHFGCPPARQGASGRAALLAVGALPPLFRISLMCRPPELDALLALEGLPVRRRLPGDGLPLAHVHPEASRGRAACLRLVHRPAHFTKVGTLRGSPIADPRPTRTAAEASTFFHAYVIEREGASPGLCPDGPGRRSGGLLRRFHTPRVPGLGLAWNC